MGPPEHSQVLDFKRLKPYHFFPVWHTNCGPNRITRCADLALGLIFEPVLESYPEN
jgi:hypothetical protein